MTLIIKPQIYITKCRPTEVKTINTFRQKE